MEGLPLTWQLVGGIWTYLIEEREADPHFKTTKEWETSYDMLAPGRSLLHTACSKGHCNVVRYLVEQCGLDGSGGDEAGVNPIHLACNTLLNHRKKPQPSWS